MGAMRKIKIKLSEEGVNELLDLQERLGIEKPETREDRRKFFEQEQEVWFG